MKGLLLYRGAAPTKAELAEIRELMPHLDLDVKETKMKLVSTIDPFYGFRAFDWNWFRALFSKTYDLKALSVMPSDLKDAGIKNHLGFYSIDGDTKHDFYISRQTKLDARAKANGFKTALAWMFCHEYLHGSVWGNTRNATQAALLVHQWEYDGLLKQKLVEDVADWYAKKEEVARLQAKLKSMTEGLSLKDRLRQIIKSFLNFGHGLLPVVQRKADLVLYDMEMLGHPMRITEGYRSIERQNELYAQGRNGDTRPKITNAKGGDSLHQYGVAADFVFRREGYNASPALWETFGSIAEKHGFEWGGRWTSFPDRPHLEMKLGYTLADFKNGKVDYIKFN